MTKYYSYIRFSTKAQAKGESLKRQLYISEQYAKRHGLTLDETYRFHDLGVSAYKSANSETGKLGAFLTLIEEGKIEVGSYLLVESFDRLSRDTAFAAMGIFSKIIRAGIIVVTLADEMVFSKANMNDQKLNWSLMSMIRSHEHSAVLSQRKKWSWDHKRKSSGIKAMTKWVPSWLEVTIDRQIIQVPDRVQKVQKIFDWAESGMGSRLILKEIEKLSWEPWGIPKNIQANKGVDGRIPQCWYQSTINKILTNRAVLGELNSLADDADRNIKLEIYPRIISDEQFYKVQQARSQRNVKGRGGIGPRSQNVSNLFSGLLKCGYSTPHNLASHVCHSEVTPVLMLDKGRRSKTKYLACSKGKDGYANCKACSKYWRYDDFEKTFLLHVQNINFSQIFTSRSKFAQSIADLRAKISTAEGKIISNQKTLDKLNAALANLEGDAPATVLKNMQVLEAEIVTCTVQRKNLNVELQELETNSLKESENKSFIQEIVTELQNNDAATRLKRIHFSQILRETVEDIHVYAKGRFTNQQQVDFLCDVAKDNSEMQSLVPYVSKNGLPFFVVNYKSGLKEMVVPNPFNSNEVLCSQILAKPIPVAFDDLKKMIIFEDLVEPK